MKHMIIFNVTYFVLTVLNSKEKRAYRFLGCLENSVANFKKFVIQRPIVITEKQVLIVD